MTAESEIDDERALTLQELSELFYDKDIEGHDQSGLEENEEIQQSDARYRGVPVKMLYFPKLFTSKGYAKVREAGETAWKILVKVIREYLDDPDYRKLFGFPEELEEMICRRPEYSVLLPVCRLDMFFDEKTGDYKFCEFNADGSSAMNENRIMTEAYRKTLMYRCFSEKYEQKEFELFDSWAQVFLDLVKETGRYTEHPQVAIVDFLEKSIASAELERFAEAFRKRGSRSCVAEIRSLTYDGEHLYTPEGFRVDAIYRRAVTSDILEHREEIRPFLDAVRDRRVCLIGDFCTQVVHDKILFKVLHLDRTKAFLTEEENRYVAQHIPYTADLVPGLLHVEKFMHTTWSDEGGRSRRWILKPEDSYGAHGIYYSGNFTDEQWQKLLRDRAGKGYVIQEYVSPYRTLNADYTDTDYTDNPWQEQAKGQKSPRVHSFANMTGMYLYAGHLAGIYSRLSPLNIISVEGDEHEMVSMVARRKNSQ